MPIYEYQCHACGEQFEVSQRIVDPPIKECPHCKQSNIERLISQTSFLLKGSGWYKDGYADSKIKPSGSEKVTEPKKEETKTVEEKPTAVSAPAGTETKK